MKLEILDAYNIRARLSPSIILLGPVGLTIFLCFEEVYTFAASAITICILMALTNYIPILQRTLNKDKSLKINHAANYLYLSDDTIDEISKRRYYSKLAELDESFSMFKNPDNSPEFHSCCESAIIYLKNITRDNHLVLEENINYGFCKNMLANKPAGIILNIILCLVIADYSLVTFGTVSEIPLANIISILFNVLFILFWIFGINKDMVKLASEKYAITLITAIDTLKIEK